MKLARLFLYVSGLLSLSAGWSAMAALDNLHNHGKCLWLLCLSLVLLGASSWCLYTYLYNCE